VGHGRAAVGTGGRGRLGEFGRGFADFAADQAADEEAGLEQGAVADPARRCPCFRSLRSVARSSHLAARGRPGYDAAEPQGLDGLPKIMEATVGCTIESPSTHESATESR